MIETKYKKILHLSHNDLDGYACQFLINGLKLNTIFFNTSYFDVNKNINLIFKELNSEEKTLILITDLNITEEVAIKLNNFKNSNKHLDFDYLVIDHHKTGIEVSLRNLDWYRLDINNCATHLVGQWIINNFNISSDKKQFIEYVMEIVDSHDRWLINHPLHSKGNLIADMVFNKINYPTILDHFKRDHIFKFLEKSFLFFMNEENTIYDFENQLNVMMLNMFKGKIDQKMFEDKNIAYEHKLIKYFTNIYSKIKTNTFCFKLKGIKYNFKVMFELESSIFQYLSHYYLEENEDVHFMVNIKSKGSCSFRSKDNIDVERIARGYFNGGGHTNASGGSIILVEPIRSENDLMELLLSRYPIELIE